ncbi:MAG: ABC transporter ATP-binding protein [Usitatibacter sp.]
MGIRVENISKRFGKVEVLRSVSLEFTEREFITLVGPSGCGKTTLLRILSGLELPDTGEIWHGDRPIGHLSPGARDIAMVFQSYALYPHMDVFHNIAYGLRVRGTPPEEIRRRVDEAARVLEITALLSRKPKELSGGQRQRVALGRAMVRKPWLFLLDEPLSNLDAKLRVTMRSELKRVHRALETTTVYVTHDQLEAMTMSDRIAVMDGGRVQQFATPEEIYGHPANLFVAGFVGSPPMNFIDGVTLVDGRLVAAGAQPLVLPVSTLERFGAAIGAGALVAGIRPQHIALHLAANAEGLAGEVQMVQLLGSEKLVEVDAGGRVLSVVVDAAVTVRSGQPAWLTFDAARLHLFNAATQANVLPSPGVHS